MGRAVVQPGNPKPATDRPLSNGVMPRPRVAFYSHDTMGLGHMRRNLLCAQALSMAAAPIDILLINGARESRNFTLPPGTDTLTLPALSKGIDGSYQARHLGLSLQEIINLRAQTIRSALASFNPDVLIVDNVPRGAARELDPTLELLREQGGTRCVLGLRDILDTPVVVRREWERAANFEAIRDYYDAVWVYGDPAVYDLASEYGFSSEIAEKIQYVGYLDQRTRLDLDAEQAADPAASPAIPPEPFALCLVGGGQDGGRLAEAFAAATFPNGMHGVILTGPFLPEATRQRLHYHANHHDHLTVLEFLSEPGFLVQRADRVVAMGGYNTVAELLSYRKRAVIVPRVLPRQEQSIRAHRLQELGIFDVIRPNEVTAQSLTAWLSSETVLNTAAVDTIDINGLARLPALVDGLVTASRMSLWTRSYEIGTEHAAP